MTTALREYRGTCHCGSIGFNYRTGLEPEAWNIRTCQCGFCRRYNARSTSDPAGSIEFVISAGDCLGHYRFSRRTADFLFCRRCGIYIGARTETSRGRFGIININALESEPGDLPAPVAMEYGDESLEQRSARREQRWTPVMENVLPHAG